MTTNEPETRSELEDCLSDVFACEDVNVNWFTNLGGGDIDRILNMSEKAKDLIPSDETVRIIELSFSAWEKPKVTVWCKSQGFDYSNSQVHDVKFMTYGRLYRGQVDVRPF